RDRCGHRRAGSGRGEDRIRFRHLPNGVHRSVPHQVRDSERRAERSRNGLPQVAKRVLAAPQPTAAA
ncbi:unnamed protein product, partial [Musa hybrid cultivar]